MENKPHLVPQKCPVCDQSQDALMYTPLSTLENASGRRTIVHVTCTSCHNKLFTFATQNEMGILTVGVLTDISTEEARACSKADAVSGDDVLDLHKHFQTKKRVSVSDLLG